MDGRPLERVLEFKYFGFMLDESGIDEAEGSRKVASGGRIADAITPLVMVFCLFNVWK